MGAQNIAKREALYKTAWSPLYAQYVSIVHAHQDDVGGWIYTATVPLRTDGKQNEEVLFRPHELAIQDRAKFVSHLMEGR